MDLGKHEISVALVNADGKPIVHAKGGVELQGQGGVLHLPPFNINGAAPLGRYEFRALVNGRHASSWPFELVLGQAASKQPPSADTGS